ncbi:MAG: FitA-like ribbon-helix-helix domain-containing protein [Terriglobia bacterium]
MANTIVRNIPDKLYATLRREAQSTGGSLNSEIIAAIRDRVEMLRQRRKRARAIADIHRLRTEIAKKYPVQTDSVQLIREDRDSR